MSILSTETGTRSVTLGSPNGVITHEVSSTASDSVTFTGGQDKPKSKVNSYVLGVHAHKSSPTSWPPAPSNPASARPIIDVKALLFILEASENICTQWKEII